MQTQPLTKACRVCKVERPLQEFTKDVKSKTDGRRRICRACESIARRIRRTRGGIRANGRAVYLKWKEDHRLEILQNKAERRALQTLLGIERVSYREIWERDEGICYLCGKPVVWGEQHFDHVVPLSLGGTHSKENIRVSHATCNLRKGAHLITMPCPSNQQSGDDYCGA